MSTKIKSGKKPVSQKRSPGLINPDEIFNSGLSIPPEVEAHAEKEGWELRYVDAAEMYKNNGQHKRGWMPYIKPKEMQTGQVGFKFGNDPDGLVRRTSLILAYRPKAQGDKHRAYLRQRTDQLAGSFQAEEAKQLRSDARKSGLDVEVLDGFDEND